MHQADDKFERELAELLELSEEGIEKAIEKARSLAGDASEQELKLLLGGATQPTAAAPATSSPQAPASADDAILSAESLEVEESLHEAPVESEPRLAEDPNLADGPLVVPRGAVSLPAEDAESWDDATSLTPQSSLQVDFDGASADDAARDMRLEAPRTDAPFGVEDIDETNVTLDDFELPESGLEDVELSDDDLLDMSDEIELEDEDPPEKGPSTHAPPSLAIGALDPDELDNHEVDDLAFTGNSAFGLDSFVDLPDEEDDIDISLDDERDP